MGTRVSTPQRHREDQTPVTQASHKLPNSLMQGEEILWDGQWPAPETGRKEGRNEALGPGTGFSG